MYTGISIHTQFSSNSRQWPETTQGKTELINCTVKIIPKKPMAFKCESRWHTQQLVCFKGFKGQMSLLCSCDPYTSFRLT